jgi:DNA-binding transcriptional LysR family regulator
MAHRTSRAYKEMSLVQFRSFCVVCEKGGYAAAARELHLTGPAIWEQMQGLERYYGVRLLERHGTGVRPTGQGRRLLEMIRPILAGLDSTRGILQQEDGALPGQLTLVTNLRVLVEEISSAMRMFQQRYPSIQLAVNYTSGAEVEPLVLSGTADLAFTLEPGPDSPPSTGTVYEDACELDYLLITRPRHALARSPALRLEEIVNHRLVLGERSAYSRRRLEEILHRHDLTRAAKVAVETSSDEYTIACVRAGMGVGITMGIPHGRLYRGLAVRSLRRWFGLARAGFLWKRGVHLPPAQVEFSRIIRTLVRRRPDAPE